MTSFATNAPLTESIMAWRSMVHDPGVVIVRKMQQRDH